MSTAAASDAASGSWRWPHLRQDLALYSGPVSGEGAPTWTVHDPVANRFFRISWLEFEILNRWSLGSAGPIVESIQRDTTIQPSAAQIELFARFAQNNNLFQAQTPEDTERLAKQQEAGKPGLPRWFLKNFLFLRVPLLRPERFLQATLPLVRWTFSPLFLRLLMATALCGFFLVSRQWAHFVHSFQHLFSPEGVVTVGFTLLLVKLLHEFGHGYATHHFGCRVPAMGVGLLVFWPVFWTDTTDAWKLADRRQRLLIDAAGILTELAIAILATLLWSLLPDGPLRSSIHLLASTTWVVTLGVNLNPLMRFDGYFLLSDWLDIPNLQNRSFAMGRWWLREQLFNYGDLPPEALPIRRRRLLITYALAVWVYRFFLFFSIALIVYHLFFKALGLLLMVYELGAFIALPILAELRVWVGRRGDLRWSPRLLLPFGILAGLLLLLFTPWRSQVSAPAVLTAGRETVLFSPQAALIEKIHVRSGEEVEEDAEIFTLNSPDLDYRIAVARQQIELLRRQISSQSVDARLAAGNPVLYQELQSAMADMEGLQSRRAQLVVRAPFAGLVTDIPGFLREAAWIAANEPMAVLVDRSRASLTAYVAEADLDRLEPQAEGRFYSESADHSPYAFRISQIDYSATRYLPRVELASVYGGPLAAQLDRAGNLVPVGSVYRVLLDGTAETPLPDRATPGRVLISAEPVSILGRIWRSTLGVLIRESGW
jgi:putative peptide zinc metalloprotease protein